MPKELCENLNPASFIAGGRIQGHSKYRRRTMILVSTLTLSKNKEDFRSSAFFSDLRPTMNFTLESESQIFALRTLIRALMPHFLESIQLSIMTKDEKLIAK